MRRVNVYAEIVAVDFALTLIYQVIDKHFQQPSKIIIYSDWNEIDKLKDTTMITKKLHTINAVAKKINVMKFLFLSSYPTIELDISYMDEEEKRYNPFYKAAHNASRKVIGI